MEKPKAQKNTPAKLLLMVVNFILIGLIALKATLILREELPGLYAGEISLGMYAIIKFLIITALLCIPAFIMVYLLWLTVKKISERVPLIKRIISSFDSQKLEHDEPVKLNVKLSAYSKEQWKVILKRIVELLSNQEKIDSKNIFINGKWGSGKTTFLAYLNSLLNKTQSNLLQDHEIKTILAPIAKQSWTLINFDPWVLHVEDDPVHSLLQRLATHEALKDLMIEDELKELIDSVTGSSETWARFLPFLKHSIKSPLRLIDEIKAKLHNDQKVLVIIDNLERCSQSQIERTVALINLFNRVHGSIFFIVTGNQHMIEEQIASYLGIVSGTKHYDDTDYIEKLFHIIPLPYNDITAANYVDQMLQDNTTGWQWRSELSVIKTQLLIPFFEGFERLNRRVCQTLTKEIIVNTGKIMEIIKPSLIDPVAEDKKREAIMVMEQLVFKLILIKSQTPHLLYELKKNSELYGNNFHYQSNNPFPKDTVILKKHDNEISRNYLLSGIKSITNPVLGEGDGGGLGAIATHRIKVITDAFYKVYPNED